MSALQPLDKAGRLIYRTLLKAAKTFDDNPACKALISRRVDTARPLPMLLDTAVSQFLGGSRKQFFWPDPLAPQSVVTAVKMGFRRPIDGQPTNLDTLSLQTLRYLTGILSVARKHNMLDTTSRKTQRRHTMTSHLEIIHASNTKNNNNTAQRISVADLTKGTFLIGHPCLHHQWFSKTVVLLCEHSNEEGTHGLCMNKQWNNKTSEVRPSSSTSGAMPGSGKEEKRRKETSSTFGAKNDFQFPRNKNPKTPPMGILLLEQEGIEQGIEQGIHKHNDDDDDAMYHAFKNALKDFRSESTITQDEDDFAESLEVMLESGNRDDILQAFIPHDENDDLVFDAQENMQRGKKDGIPGRKEELDFTQQFLKGAKEEFSTDVFNMIGEAMMAYTNNEGRGRRRRKSDQQQQKIRNQYTSSTSSGTRVRHPAGMAGANDDDNDDDYGKKIEEEEEYLTAKDLLTKIDSLNKNMFYGGPIPGIDILHGYSSLGGLLVLGTDSTLSDTQSKKNKDDIDSTTKNSDIDVVHDNNVYVGIGVSKKHAENILHTINNDKNKRIRIYLGHSGWSPGQLESEIEAGSWALVKINPLMFDVFDSSLQSCATADGKNGESVLQERIWSDMLCMLGDEYSVLAEVPDGVWEDLRHLEI